MVLWLGSIAGRVSPVPGLPYVHTGLTVIIFAIAYLNAAQPGLSADKILALGFDCGFSSKSALNSNFKKFTGLTPTEFREQHLQERDGARPERAP